MREARATCGQSLYAACVLFCCCLPVAATTFGQTRPLDGATPHELAQKLARLAGSADDAQIELARQRLLELAPNQQRRIAELLARVSAWERATERETSSREAGARRIAAPSSRGFSASSNESVGDARAGAEENRAELVLFLQELRTLSPLMSPEYDRRLGSAIERVETLPAEQIDGVALAILLRTARWAEDQGKAAAEPAAASEPVLVSSSAPLVSFTCPVVDFSCRYRAPNPCGRVAGVNVCAYPKDGYLHIFSERPGAFDICGDISAVLNQACNAASGFASDINAFLTDTGSEIQSAFDTVVGEAEGLGDDLLGILDGFETSVLGLLNELLDLLPLEFNEDFELVGFDVGKAIDLVGLATGIDADSETWWEALPGLGAVAPAPSVAPASVSQAAGGLLSSGGLLCPRKGVTPDPMLVPIELIFGDVGSPGAEIVCRKLDLVLNDIYDLIPAEVAMLKLRIVGSVIYFPINYLCLCLEQEAKRNYIGRSLFLHTRGYERVDVNVSDVASRDQMTDLRGKLATAIEALGVADSELRAALGYAALLRGMVGDQNGFVVEMIQLLDRLDIEEHLLDQSDIEESLLALPAARGGRLEDVGVIVWDTIQAAIAAGEPVFRAVELFASGADAESVGDHSRAFRDYQKAYLEAVKTTSSRGGGTKS